MLSNLIGIAVEFLFQSISIMVGDPSIADIASNRFINIFVCLGFMALATFISYRGMTSTKVFQSTSQWSFRWRS